MEYKVTLSAPSPAGFSDGYKPNITKTYFLASEAEILAYKLKFAIEFNIDSNLIEVVDFWAVQDEI